MSLNNKTLSSPVMSGNILSDEQESVRLRYEFGGRANGPDLADIYDRTGNMRVARTLAKYQRGGMIPGMDPAFASSKTEANDDTPQEPSWWDKNKRGIGSGIADVSSGLLNVAPNLANIKDYRELPSVPTPSLGKSIALEEPNLESTRQALIAQGRSNQQQADVGSAQSGQQQAGRAQALAHTQSALSRLGGEEARMQTEVQNQNRIANQQTQARNLGTMNQFYQDQTGRELAITRGIAGERAMMANKALGALGDMRQRQLDNDRMNLVGMRFAQEGTLKRALDDAIASGNDEMAQFYMQQLGYE